MICIGTVVNSPKTAKKLKSCTDVTGDIVISVIDAEITSILEENLQHIETIQGKLKIERSHSLVSLYFFKSLKEIRGEGHSPMTGGDQKVLTIFENDNLQKLFPDNREVKLPMLNLNMTHGVLLDQAWQCWRTANGVYPLQPKAVHEGGQPVPGPVKGAQRPPY